MKSYFTDTCVGGIGPGPDRVGGIGPGPETELVKEKPAADKTNVRTIKRVTIFMKCVSSNFLLFRKIAFRNCCKLLIEYKRN